MKAMLLAAGLGLRLRPITNKIPKCLVPIKGVPLLGIWLKNMKEAGIGPFFINTHYLHEQVEDFINTLDFNHEITISKEKELLGTAGTLIKNISFFGKEDGLLIHADNYCLADLKEFIETHENRPSHCLITMMTFKTDNPSSCGIVELDKNQVVIGFHEKVSNPPGNLANGAIYILSSELLDILEVQQIAVNNFSEDILPKLMGKIFTYQTEEVFIDIGTRESYEIANKISV